jgi:hypothetical protein
MLMRRLLIGYSIHSGVRVSWKCFQLEAERIESSSSLLADGENVDQVVEWVTFTGLGSMRRSRVLETERIVGSFSAVKLIVARRRRIASSLIASGTLTSCGAACKEGSTGKTRYTCRRATACLQNGL